MEILHTVICLTSDELDKLIDKKLHPNYKVQKTKYGDRIDKYEVIAAEGWSNYEYHLLKITEESLHRYSPEYPHEGLADVEDFIKTGIWKEFDPRIEDLLFYMALHDLIEFGNYLIEVSW